MGKKKGDRKKRKEQKERIRETSNEKTNKYNHDILLRI